MQARTCDGQLLLKHATSKYSQEWRAMQMLEVAKEALEVAKESLEVAKENLEVTKDTLVVKADIANSLRQVVGNMSTPSPPNELQKRQVQHLD